MGRPPCCDKVGIKKGPWTPEEDIILVSYIQEHGPGNWRSVPTNTGLLRCSKSCRLRWTNYLRPGIKRGNFTPHEEGMIIHLQALLGNKWAAIASYLPQRTDNDIKNYWNTHLKKKIKSQQPDSQVQIQLDSTSKTYEFVPRSRSNSGTQNLVTSSALNQNHHYCSTSLYASSAENISRLLDGWMRSSPSSRASTNIKTSANDSGSSKGCETGILLGKISKCYKPVMMHDDYQPGAGMILKDEIESILSFDHSNLNVLPWDKSSFDSSTQKNSDSNDDKVASNVPLEEKPPKLQGDNPPLTFLENWLLDESAEAQVGEIMEIPSII